MKIFRKVTIMTIWGLLISATGYAGTGETAGIILNKAVTVNQAALSGAVTANSGLDTMRINPAGLTGIKGQDISLMYNNGYFEDNFISVAYAREMGFINMGANIVYSATDKIGIWSEDNNYIEEIGQQDIIVSFSASFDNLINSVPVGINLTMLNSSIFGNSATAFSAGAGLQHSLSLLGNELRIGAGIQNIGTNIKYLEQETPLPSFGQAGVTYNFPLGKSELTLNTDLRLPLNSEDLYLMGGVKYDPVKNISLLVGGETNLDSNISQDKLNIGTEIRAGNYKFSYVVDMVKNIDLSHYISIGFQL